MCKFNSKLTCPLVLLVMLLVSATQLYWVEQVNADTCVHTKWGEPRHKSLMTNLGLASLPQWNKICREGYFAAFNPEHNVSDWVAVRLQRENLFPKDPAERKDNFKADPKVSEEHQVVKRDYNKTGYDRGHLAPAASMIRSQKIMDESFFMTNIAPQVGSGFNQHIWKSLEKKMRRWACDRGELYIVTGPLYEVNSVEQLMNDANGDGIDDNNILVDIPTHFFKLAFDPISVEAIAFILPNMKLSTKNLQNYIVSIAEIEARSGFDFLYRLSDNVEYVVENNVQPRFWPDPSNKQCMSIN